MNIYLYKRIIDKLKKIIIINKKYKKNFILVSISAGQDSIYLIKLLETIKTNFLGILKLEYIYIDHQWKKNSKSQIKHIINYLKCFNSSLYIYQIKKKCYSETQARANRYQILFNHAKINNNIIIITGHNLTDKIETFLQNLFKGTTIDGATSLSEYRKSINDFILFRPLINNSRNEIYWLCKTLYLPIWSDQTNYYYYITRNRLRYELLPYLKNYFSANIEKHLNSFLRISNIENEYLKQNTIKIYLITRHNEMIAINYTIIKLQHIAIQKRIFQLFSLYHFNQLFNKELIEKILFHLNSTPLNQSLYIQWNKNKYICIQEKWLYIH
uniref:tRNA(Ile)-lysidine synthase n=1 Tax=Campylaephora sungminbooi TaxID=1896769 RepID=A0A1B0TIG4_9FLOR|nr:hypothetical protein 327 [Campylaephora sungminbooi]